MAIVALAAGLLYPSDGVGAPSPNIVFIFADDMGFGDTGITGQNARLAAGLPAFATPNIDAIAQQGMQFSNMYAGAPTCSPSRNALLTGFHQGHTFFDRANVEQDIRAGEQDKTWGQILQTAGYKTAVLGKWHLGGFLNTVRTPTALPTQKGFETSLLTSHRYVFTWENDNSGSIRLVATPSDPTYTGPGGPYQFGDNFATDRAVQFIRQNAAASQPFAAYLPYHAPHSLLDRVPQNHPYANMPWPQAQRDYAGMMYALDQNVGRVLAALDDPNGDGNTSDSVASNTLVMFASDHGVTLNDSSSGFNYEFFDSNGIYSGTKFQNYEGGIRTPFFARWTGTIPAGTVNNSYVGSLADVLPTFSELTGQDVPLGIDGRSMVADLTGGVSDQRDVLPFTTEVQIGPANPAGWAVRVGDWKLHKRFPTTIFPTVTYRLFNLANDPREITDLASARPDVVAALEAIGQLEGFDQEPFGPSPQNPSIQETKNTYFTQYKTWAPQGDSTDFFAASNWAGGTQSNGVANNPDANNWNTGPADNWLATLKNVGGSQLVSLNADATVLAIEVASDGGQMRLAVEPGRKLTARNGVRISGGGVVDLNGGELNTIRDIDIRPGGTLRGHGLVNGQQAIVANIPELAGLGLFVPNVINNGDLIVGPADSAGTMTINGDFRQGAAGSLLFDVFNASGPSGFDVFTVQGKATLAGLLNVSLGAGAEMPSLGDVFPVLTAAGGINGLFNAVSLPSLDPALSWNVVYQPNAVSLEVIENAAANLTIDASGPLGASVTISGDQTIDVIGQLRIGRDDAPGYLTIGPGGVVNVGDSTVIDLAGTFVLRGGLLSTRTLDLMPDGTFDWQAGTLRFTDHVQLTDNSALGASPLISDGRTLEALQDLTLTAGSLFITAGGTVAVSGATTIASGGILFLEGGTLSTATLGTSDDGIFQWQSGTLRFTGHHALAAAGPLGAAPVLETGKVLEVAGNLSIESADLSIRADGRLQVGGEISVQDGAALRLNGGMLATTSLTVAPAGVFEWSTGTLRYEQDYILDPAGVLGMAPVVADGQRLEVGNNLTVGAAVLTIAPGGEAVVTGETLVMAEGGLAIAGGLLATSSLNLAAGSSFDWQSGTLRFTDGVTIAQGAVLGDAVVVANSRRLEVAAQLDIGPGSLTIGDSGAAAAGATVIGPGGSLELAGGEFSTASLAVNETGQFLWQSGRLHLTNDFEHSSTGPLAGYPQIADGRTLDVGGNLKVAAALTIASGGVLEASGETLVDGGPLMLDGGLLTTGSLVLAPGGHFNFVTGDLAITGSAGAVVGPESALGQTFTLAVNQSLDVTHALRIAPGGIVQVEGGALTAAVLAMEGGRFSGFSLDGFGAVEFNSGVIDLSGSLSIAEGQVLGFAPTIAADQTLKVGGQIHVGGPTGPASLYIDEAGEVRVDQELVIHADSVVLLHGGALTISGFEAEAGASFVWNSGRLAFNGNLAINPAGELGDNLAVFDGQELGVGQDLSVGAGSLSINYGAAVDVAGTLHLGPDGTLTLAGGRVAASSYVYDPAAAFDWQSGELHIAQDAAVSANDFVGQVLGSGMQLGLGKHLSIGGVATFASPLTINGGTLSVGAMTNPALLVFESGRLNITNSNLTIGPGGTFGSTLSVENGRHIHVVNTVEIAAGSLLAVKDGADLGAGALHNSGEILLDGLTAEISAGALINQGTLRGRGRIAGAVVNAASGEVYVQGGRRMNFTGPSVENLGRIAAVGVAAEPAEIVFAGPVSTAENTGVIAGAFSRFKFDGGLTSAGSLAFTAGDNHVFGDITSEGAILVSGGAQVAFYDDLTHNGTLQVSKAGSTTSVAIFLGDVTGAGGSTGGGDIFFEGDLRPGQSPARVIYDNNIFLRSQSTVEIEIAGTAAGAFDQIEVGGALELAGALQVTLLDNYLPAAGDVFEILTATLGLQGAFSQASLPTLPFGMSWNVAYTATGVSLEVVPGSPNADFDGDGDVDGADFLTWQRGVGAESGATPPLGDANFDGAVNNLDLAYWKATFAAVPGLASASPVPEPAAISFAVSLALVLTAIRRPSRRLL